MDIKTLTKTLKMKLPTVDGHFWVERDGEITDWDFPESAVERWMYGCETEKSYLPAPVQTQQIIISVCQRSLYSNFEKGLSWNETVQELYKVATKFGEYKSETRVRSLLLQLSCLVERIHSRGGKLVFGSIGYKKKNGKGYHYEFGGVDYKTVKNFLTFSA